jgi:hypothetical protein
MTKLLRMTALLAMGLLVATSIAAAQDAPAKTSGGTIVFGALGVKDISSAKFEEYREIAKGISIPYANIFTRKDNVDFNLHAFNVRQTDQRYTGWLTSGRFGVSFDYNQTPHNMGNNARTMYSESASGVWMMSSTLRQSIQTTHDTKLPTTARTVDFYDALLAPTLAAANTLDISQVRKRGSAELLYGGGDNPYVFAASYMRQQRSGYRRASGGNIRGVVNGSFEVPETSNDVVQDFGFRAAYNFAKGNVHAAFNRNLYNNDAETMIVDNPFQAFDAISTNAAGAIPALGGPARGLFINAPDNEASTGSAGFLLKFAHQTRISGDVAMAQWTQNAAFYPYTINSVVLTGTGQPANLVSSLQKPSLNGKINTTTMNLNFSSRPVKNLGLRASYRVYDLVNKTDRWVITGDVAANPDRLWGTVTAAADAPYGHATANPYDTKTARFNAIASYDFGDLTLEGSFHNTQITRSYREATKGEDTGYMGAAIYRYNDLVSLRAKYEDVKRTATGETFYGFQSDEAARDTKRTSVAVVLSPMPTLDLSFDYGKRDVEFTDRPNRRATTAGAPEIPNTPVGLLNAKYDTYTVELDFTPNERAEVGAYYTYEKDRSTNQWATLTGTALNNLLNYAGSDKTDTFGANAVFHLVPEKSTFTLSAMRQKVDGLMDITAREAGSFYTPGRTTLIASGQGGAADIVDYDDTELTTLVAHFDYTVATDWKIGLGYSFEKYDFRDAYTQGTLLMPAAVYISLKPDNGAYKAHVVYAKLSYKF